MLKLLENNQEFNYRLYQSQIIVEQVDAMVNELNLAIIKFQKQFPRKDSTWTYKFYNTFSLTATSPLFYELLTDLKTVIREYVGDDRPLWFQSWINYHHSYQLLDWHNHDWPFHGYISIDPKQSKTIFREYEIENQIGKIYIGPGHREHKVEAIEHFSSPRITLGFDVTDKAGLSTDCFSLIPI